MVAAWVATGAAICGLGVLLGAFGAHGLRGRVTPEMVAVFETGVRYHLVHGLALHNGRLQKHVRVVERFLE